MTRELAATAVLEPDQGLEETLQTSRFHDRVLSALLRLRFRTRPLDFAFPLLLWREAPLLACGLPQRELAVLGLQRDLKFGLHSLLPAAYLAAMAQMASANWPYELSERLWLAAAIAGGLAIAAICVLIKTNTLLRTGLLLRLEESDILQRLAFQEEQLEDIYAAVPDLLRPVFMSLRRSGLDQHMALVAYNLDWFLRPSTCLVRLNWICEALLFPFALTCWLYSLLGLPAGSLQEEPFVYAMAFLTLGSLLVSLWARRRTEVFMEALIVHLREQLEA